MREPKHDACHAHRAQRSQKAIKNQELRQYIWRHSMLRRRGVMHAPRAARVIPMATRSHLIGAVCKLEAALCVYGNRATKKRPTRGRRPVGEGTPMRSAA